MPSAINKVIKIFPHPTTQPTVGQPTYKTLAEVNLKLNKNAASVHSHLGNGQLGLLFLTISPAIYNNQSNTVFVPPANPSPSPIIPQGFTAVQIADICQQYDVDSDLYTEYDMMDKALKSLLIDAVNKTYIQSLREKYIGYANVTTKEMLAHLYLADTKISDGYLEENDKRMRANYDVNQPMEVLIENIDDAVDIAAAADNPY